MSASNRKLPPLNALRAFEAAARHLSFSRAADELHVTPAAISRQIKTLEDYLDVKLFQRLNRSLALTDAGRAGLPGLEAGFDSLSEATERMQRSIETEIVTVAMAPSFAAKWFMPRLHRFTTGHRNIELRIAAGMELIDTREPPERLARAMRRNQIDVAVRFGGGEYPDCRVDKLLSVSVVPMCSPRLLEGEHPLRDPSDLRFHTLLHDDTAYEGRPSWKDWLDAAGASDVNTRGGLHFNHVALALGAAIEGQGVVLSLRPLAEDDLAAGRLVIPFDITLDLDFAYYIISPSSYADGPAVNAFRDWLIEEADPGRPIIDA